MSDAKPNAVRYTGVALLADDNQLKRIQSISSSTDFSEERLLELANKGVAEVVDTASVSATVEANDYGSTENFAAFLGQGIYNSTRTNDYFITDASFDNARVDIVTKTASNDVSLERSMWLGSLYLTSVAMAYSADGIATETYDFEGEHKRWFLNTYKNIHAYKADFSTSSVVLISGVDVSSDTPLLLTVGGIIRADVDGGDTITTNFVSSNTEITTNVSGLTFTSAETFRLITYSSGATFPNLVTTPAGIGGVRRGMITISLWNVDGTEEKTLRVSSADITVDLSREEKVELGTDKAYFRQLTRPIEVTMDLDMMDSDLEIYAKLSGNESAFDSDSLNQFSADDFKKTNQLLIKIYNTEDQRAHSASNLLKMIQIDNCSVSSEEESITVGEDGTVSLSLLSDGILISGTGLNPIT